MTKKPIVSSVSVSFYIFCVQQYTRTTVINNNIDDQGPGPPQLNFFQPIKMYNLAEIKGFYLRICLLGLSSKPFYEHNAITRAGFTIWHCARGPALRWQDFTFGLHLCLTGRCCKNLQRARGPAQCKSGPGNNMVSRRNDLSYVFQ